MSAVLGPAAVGAFEARLVPVRSATALGVLRLVDDPDASAVQLSRALASDAGFAARVLRVANSPYYGLSGRVSTLPFAVSVVGFQTIRSLAVAAAAGLQGLDAAPHGFWRAAATAATAAEAVAAPLGAPTGDAFSIGLLHGLGTALLHQHRPGALVCLPDPRDPAAFLAAEDERYGLTHDAAAAQVLAAWHVPTRLCVLIGRHHEPLLPDAGALERALHLARWVSDHLLRVDLEQGGAGSGGEARGGPPEQPLAAGDVAWMSDGRLSATDVEPLLELVRVRAEGLLEGLAAAG